MKIRRMAKLHISYFCNFKAHHFKQGHKANLCLKAYNPSHTAVLSAEGCHDFVFDNRTCHCCCCIMYNTHLGTCIISFHYFSPLRRQVSTFLCSLPFQQLEKTPAKLLESVGIWVCAKENDWHCEQKQHPTSGEELWAEPFYVPDVSWRVSLGETQEIKMRHFKMRG